MTGQIHTVLVPGVTRPVIMGEYPYYRADPSHWADNLLELRRLGIDVVSFYLPWRFHEISEGPERTFDFCGKSDAQRDVVGLLALAAEAGLGVFVKPGPFIHAEVQLGGLPDRLCGPEHTSYRGLNGTVLTSQAQPLPSLIDPAVMTEVEVWLHAVAKEVVVPAKAPQGPIVALQLGNEGTCGDAHIAIDAQDASPAARDAFGAWLAGRGHAAEAGLTGMQLAGWPVGMRLLWSQWSGHAIVGLWDWIADLFPKGLAAVANVPLAPATGTGATLDAWAARHRAFKGSRHFIGHTEWVGNPAVDPEAFCSHLVGMLLGGTDVLEANWGFIWTDDTFAQASTPLFNALRALILGSTTVSVYTACAAGIWGELIDMDPEGQTAEGVDPALHAPPYCPGAPLAESGVLNPTAEGVQLLAGFLDRFGEQLLDSELERDAVVIVDRALSEAGAWQSGEEETVLQELAAAVQDQLVRNSRLVGLAWLDERDTHSDTLTIPAGLLRAGEGAAAPGELTLAAGHPAGGAVAAYVETLPYASGVPRWTSAQGFAVVLNRTGREGTIQIIGAFNPMEGADRVTGETGGHNWQLDLPGGSAVVAVVRDGELLGWVATPPAPESDTSTPTLMWGGEPADAERIGTVN